MMNVSYTGYNTKYLTMINNDANIGNLVNIDPQNKATNATEGTNFIGLVVTKRGDIVGIQEQGYVELGYSGEKPTGTYCKLVAAETGKVKVDASKGEKAYKIIKIDESNQIVGFLL